MATGSLTDSPWLFKNYQANRAFKHPEHGAAFLWPAIPRADYIRRPGLKNLPEESYEMANSRKPALRGPTPRSRP